VVTKRRRKEVSTDRVDICQPSAGGGGGNEMFIRHGGWDPEIGGVGGGGGFAIVKNLGGRRVSSW